MRICDYWQAYTANAKYPADVISITFIDQQCPQRDPRATKSKLLSASRGDIYIRNSERVYW
jgi:hypothetical protein